MAKKPANNLNRWIYFLIFVGVTAMLIPGKRGLYNHFRLYQKAYRLRREIRELEVRKLQLQEQIRELNDSKTIERIAREKYGMARDNEKVYRIVPKEQN